MEIANSVALVTGANRGLGRQFARQLLDRGAAKVYATARNPDRVDLPGVEVLRLDVTDPGSIAAAATVATDVTLLVNNAGLITGENLVTGDPAAIRLEMDTHFYGTLEVIRAFAPVLAANGGGAILNVLSSMSWVSYDRATAYSAAKAAQWSLTNGVRVELAGQGTLVTGVLLGPTDTDMTAGLDMPKNDPADVVRAALDGVAADRIEVLADQGVVDLKAALAADPTLLYPQAARV
ncbi:SDR family oxidoreductase [Saccharothrix stipae]